jgi:inner membrane protein
MMGRTHLLLGINSLWLLEGAGAVTLPLLGTAPLSAPERFALCVASASLGALLPDLDASSSLLQNVSLGGVRPLIPLGQALHRHFGHRGFLHSLRALWTLGALTSPLLLFDLPLYYWPWLCLLLGYGSHLLGDACTKSGVPLLWQPSALKQRSIHLLPKSLRLTTGSQAEEAVFALLGALALALVLRHLPFGAP